MEEKQIIWKLMNGDLLFKEQLKVCEIPPPGRIVCWMTVDYEVKKIRETFETRQVEIFVEVCQIEKQKVASELNNVSVDAAGETIKKIYRTFTAVKSIKYNGGRDNWSLVWQRGGTKAETIHVNSLSEIYILLKDVF